jgi:hypothetical protein
VVEVKHQGQVLEYSVRERNGGRAAKARARLLRAAALPGEPRGTGGLLEAGAALAARTPGAAQVDAPGGPILPNPERDLPGDRGQRERLLPPGLQQRRQVPGLRALRGIRLPDPGVQGASATCCRHQPGRPANITSQT